MSLIKEIFGSVGSGLIGLYQSFDLKSCLLSLGMILWDLGLLAQKLVERTKRPRTGAEFT